MELRDSGQLIHDGMVVGRFEGDTLTLNGGWLRAAGVKLVVHGDPSHDRNKTVLQYPKPGRTVDEFGDEHPTGTVLASVHEGEDATAGGAQIGQKSSEMTLQES